MFEKLPCRYTKVGVFLEALHEEITDGLEINHISLPIAGQAAIPETYRRGAFRKWGVIIIDNPKECLHRGKFVVWWFPI
jgi:hypothetical protein